MKTGGTFGDKSDLSASTAAAAAGETISATTSAVAPREFGVASSLFEARAIVVAEDFDAPLPPEFVAKLEGA